MRLPQPSIQQPPNTLFIVCLLMLLTLFSRLIPHVANVTAMTALCLTLPALLSTRYVILCIVATLVGSDLALALINYHACFGDWTIFSYTGFIIIAYLYVWKPTIFVPLYSLLFWLWTNFGVWYLSNIYAHSWAGLTNCYITALPFLRNAIVGDLIWFTVLYFLLSATTSSYTIGHIYVTIQRFFRSA